MEIISRAEAKAKGLKRYFTGVPCKHGHVDERLVSVGSCCECNRGHGRKHYQENIDKYLDSSRKYYQDNTEKVRDNCRKYYHANLEKHRENSRKWRLANPEKNRESRRKSYHANKDDPEFRAKECERTRKWQKANPHKVLAIKAKRRAQERQATTQWGNQGIEDFYLCASMASLYTGQPVHVDHIVPLAGKKVCGLHNEFNLQLLYGVENIRKSNRYHIE